MGEKRGGKGGEKREGEDMMMRCVERLCYRIVIFQKAGWSHTSIVFGFLAKIYSTSL